MRWPRSSTLARLAALLNRLAVDGDLQALVAAEPERLPGALGLAVPPPPGPLELSAFSIALDAELILPRTLPASRVAAPGEDLRLLAYGARPAAVLHGPAADMAGVARWADGLGLTGLLSPLAFTPATGPGRGAFADLADAPRRAAADDDGWRALVLGATPDTAIAAWLSLSLGWDAWLGALLGYPPCCTSVFARRWARARDEHHGDVGAVLVEEQAPPAASVWPWASNVFARYTGPVLTPHFPCRLDCPATVAAAQRTFAVLAAHEPATAERLRDAAAWPTVVTPASGVAVLAGADVEVAGDDVVVEFDPDRLRASDPDAPAMRALHAAGRVCARGRDPNVEVGDVVVPGRLLVFGEPRDTELDDQEAADALPVGSGT